MPSSQLLTNCSSQSRRRAQQVGTNLRNYAPFSTIASNRRTPQRPELVRGSQTGGSPERCLLAGTGQAKKRSARQRLRKAAYRVNRRAAFCFAASTEREGKGD